jgi:hypothetical protein
MRLQATDVTKGRRLSLGVEKLPAPERKEAITQGVKKPPTMEEIAYTQGITNEEKAYTQIVAKYPKVEELVKRLGLVSTLTNKPIRKVEIEEDYKANKVSKLQEIAQRVITPEKAYSLEEVLILIAEDTKISKERAEIGLALMLEAGAIERSGDLYYLGGSTPF